MIYNILRDYKMLNCEVLIRDENGTGPPPLPTSSIKNKLTNLATVDDFIDVIMAPHRRYIKWYSPHTFSPSPLLLLLLPKLTPPI